MQTADPATACPCGRGEPYDSCCGPLHRGRARAVTAEQLMRSRYSAFAVGDLAHLTASWHPSTRPAAIRLDPARRWVGLQILRTSAGGMLDAEGTVEFRASYLDGTGAASQRGTQVEHSRFVRQGGRWLYLGAL